MELTLTRPDDWHLHLRDGAALAGTVPSAARYFGRAIVMPNLTPPIIDGAMALAYRERILAQRPAGSAWQPLMVIYLTDRTSRDTVARALEAGVTAAKLYPAGATTNSEAGVAQLEGLYDTLAAMEEVAAGAAVSFSQALAGLLLEQGHDQSSCLGSGTSPAGTWQNACRRALPPQRPVCPGPSVIAT